MNDSSLALLKRLHRPLVVMACAALPLAAQAGRPLATEDAGVLDAGSCEFEAFAATERATASPVLRSHAFQVGCGVGARTQLALGFRGALLGWTGLVQGKIRMQAARGLAGFRERAGR